MRMSNQYLEGLGSLSVEELEGRSKVRFSIVEDNAALMDHFANSIANEIRSRNRAKEPTRLILPIGPVKQYARLVETCNRERISWKTVHVFNMDEFLDWEGRPIPLSHPLSFEGYMRREVFGKLETELRPPEDHLIFPHPFRIDEASEAIERGGGIDCCYGGIGYHGHIAFNEPPLSRWYNISAEELRSSKTRVIALGDDSIVVQSIHSAGGNSAAIPPMAVTLGMKDILGSREIRLYCAAGERHKSIFRVTVAGEVTSFFPSTLVQGHPDTEVITDRATAAPIKVGLG